MGCWGCCGGFTGAVGTRKAGGAGRVAGPGVIMKAPGSGRCGVAGFMFAFGRVEDAMQVTGFEILSGRQTAELRESRRAQRRLYEHAYKRDCRRRNWREGGGRGWREDGGSVSATRAGAFAVVKVDEKRAPSTKALA